MGARPKYFEQVNRQRSITEYIPYSSHLTPDTIITREGDLLRIWKVSGIPFETVDPEDVVLRKEQLNTMLRSVGSQNVALWTHTLRRRTSDRLDGVFENDFCRDFNKKYFDSFTGYRMMANELYLTLVYRPTPTRMERSLLRASRRTVEERLKDQKAALSKLDELSYQLEAAMRRYDIEPLTAHTDESGVECSDMLTFLNFLLCGEWQKVRIPRAPLHEYLGNAWIFAGTETVELRTPTRTRFAQALDFKDYTAHTEPGAAGARRPTSKRTLMRICVKPPAIIAMISFGFIST